MGFNELNAIVFKPGLELNLKCSIKCECGFTRHLGYMLTTANHLADRHRAIGPDHNVTIHTWDAPPLTRSVMTSRGKKSTPRRRNRATIDVGAEAFGAS